MARIHEPSTTPDVTVGDLLAEDLLQGCLIGGGDGLGRIVGWCVPLEEMPGDAAGANSDDDLTGLAVFVPAVLLSGPEGVGLICYLSERGAAMVLAGSRQVASPTDLTLAGDAADAAGLPLLRLSPRATFREVSRLIATKVLAQSTHVLEYGTRVHRTLADVFARGAGLLSLVRTMSQLTGTTVLVIGSAGELLASAGAGASASAGSGDVDPVEPALLGKLLELLKPVERVREPSHHTSAHAVTLQGGDAMTQLIICPVLVVGEPYGFLVLIEPSHPADAHDLAQHIVVAEQGVTLAASELLRQQSVREAEERARNDFVHALLHGRFTDQLELAARADHYGFPLGGHVAVLIVTAPGLRPDEKAGRLTAREAARAAQTLVPEGNAVTLTAVVGSMLVLVRELPGEPSAGTDAPPHESLTSFATALHRSMRQRLGEETRVSYGGSGTGAPGAARSYREARTAEALARRVGTGPVNSYSGLRVFAALEGAAKSLSGQAFAKEMLVPLQQVDGQTGNLQEVVRAYIEESGNLNAAARRLHLHRNTMLYKLDRASRALGMDLKTSEAQFMVWLAHHIDSLSDVSTALDKELAPPT